ncbi:MAG: hypothetical protein DI549_19960 [Ancylobacter novellus]|uniref:Conjugal transfer protein TraN n=1 Tax=Ancylobacter novellus TaxID=921 RepID=A0A2W5QRI0_ANCNO|nr:MAG: hypothetical protein DI549_19960 [Ancylobacter novellus]
MGMRSILTALAGALVTALLLVGGAHAADAPMGPYYKACFDITVKGTTLDAKCFLASGGQQQVRLDDFAQCLPNSITFEPARGVLSCSYGFSAPAGPYTASCSKVEVVPSTLTAECRNNLGQTRTTRLGNWQDCEAQTIRYANGELVCTWKFKAPAGSYTSTCESIARESAAVMSASCTSIGGTRIKTSLRFFDACKPGSIRNADGKLVCDYDGLPVGAYMASCDSLEAVTDENVPSLKASCRAPGASALTPSTLYNIPDCVADSITVGRDGRLTCTSRVASRPVPPPGPYLADCRKTWWQADRMLRIGCPKSDGGIKIHVFNALECKDDTVAIDYGTAVCTLKSGGPSVPGGSYKLSCADRRMDGRKLVAMCNHSFSEVFLPDATNCNPDSVALMNGRLVCTLANGKSTDVEGPYKKDCATAALRPDNSLIAFCGKVETTLAGADQCAPNSIAFLDGALRCRTRTQAPGIPTGPYTETCYSPRLADGALQALCPGHDGAYRQTRLAAISDCAANSVEFSSGSLSCRYLSGRRGIPEGPYKQRCINATIGADGALTATCNTGRSMSMVNGMPTATLLNWETCRPGTIDVEHGNLFCTYTSGEPSIPAGGYRQACLNLRIENGDLKGTCETGATNGFGVAWTKETVLRQVGNCGVGTVRVAEGFLGCTYVKGWTENVPAGAFRQSCLNLSVNPAGALTGNCYGKAGEGGALTSIPNVAACEPDTIRANNQKLSCLYKAGAVVPEQSRGPFLEACKDVKVDAAGVLTAACVVEGGAPRTLHFADIHFCVPDTLALREGRLWCQPVPALGPFAESCTVAVSDDAALAGDCPNWPLTMPATRLDQFAECERGSIVNRQGHLACNRLAAADPEAVLPGQKRGAFLRACTDITVTDMGRLTARCPDAEGRPIAMSFADVRLCQPDTLVSEEGGLWCKPAGRVGAFTGSCSVLMSHEGTLKGTCRNDRRADVPVKLEMIERCIGGSINNANGRLLCERDWQDKLGTVMPEHKVGPFTATCSDIAIAADGRLTAQCTEAGGTPKALSFQDVRSCEPNSMTNEKGRLWCTPFATLGSFATSCSLRLNDADTLEGTCSNGYWDIQTKLDRIATCQPGSVGNSNGNLTCSRVKG